DLAPDAPVRRPFLVFAPSIGSKPSTGFNGGFNANMAFFRGDPATTHISTIAGGFKVSQKGQTLSRVKLAMFPASDRWFIQSDTRLSLTSQNTYELGSDSPASDAENAAYTSDRLYESVYRQITHGLFVGGGLNYSRHANVRPTA